VHGMSQRGGSVVTYVKFGEKVYSPIVEKGTADVILAFETLEGARYVDWLRKQGTLIVSTQKIDPMPVITGAVEYPNKLVDELSAMPIRFFNVDAVTLAKEAGSVRATNVVLLGILAKTTDIPREQWEIAIKEIVPEKLIATNIKAFALGYEI
jgi:indolepyruvate ferredoxin oxidoreductase beta subunit